jgi:hypothetical protein
MTVMRPIRSIATALLLAGVAVAGCAGNQPDQRSAPAANPPIVSAPPTVTTPPATKTPATKTPATKTPATKTPAITTPPATSRHSTSKAAVLADGRHPVYIRTVDPDSRKITFDLIQFYFSDDATREAAKDHKESAPPNDYYIRNVNPALRTLPVRADATVTVNTLAAGYTGSATKNVSVQLYRLQIMLDAHGYSPPFWITVRSDQVTKVAEQYLP